LRRHQKMFLSITLKLLPPGQLIPFEYLRSEGIRIMRKRYLALHGYSFVQLIRGGEARDHSRSVFSGMARPEKIEYRPVSVRDLLVEMKDLSELMIDLAYSAALFNSRDLAEEVLDLEERVDTLAYLLDMSVMLAVRDAEDAESVVGICTVAAAADKISDAAADIAAVVLGEIGVHPIVRGAFARVEEQLIRVLVRPGSILLQKSLEELELAARIGVDILAIHRGKELIVNPAGGERIHEEDVVIARGVPAGVEELRGLAEGTIRELE